MKKTCRNCGNKSCWATGCFDWNACDEWVLDRTDEELEERNRELQIIENKIEEATNE